MPLRTCTPIVPEPPEHSVRISWRRQSCKPASGSPSRCLLEPARRRPRWNTMSVVGSRPEPTVGPEGRRTGGAESSQGKCWANAAGALDEPLRHRRLVRVPDAAAAAHREASGRLDPSDHPRPSVRRQVEAALLRGSRNSDGSSRWRLTTCRSVVFLGGPDFGYPPPLGTTDRTRYVKVTSLDEAQRPELLKWMEEASRTPGWS